MAFASGLTVHLVWQNLPVVKTLTTYAFTRHFGRHKKEACLVTSQGRLIGTWQPVSRKLDRVNFADRVKEYCSAPLPFTFAELLKEGKR